MTRSRIAARSFGAGMLLVAAWFVSPAIAAKLENTFYAEERETNRIKDEFLSTLSHELRTPLNAILGWTQLLRMEKLDNEVSHGLEVIERNAKAQAKLVEDLLDVSRVTTGKLRQRQDAISGAGYASQNDQRLHFGLGAATKIDKVEIKWPGGATETVTLPGCDRAFTLVEGKGVVSK